jgi:hypothetical protein
MSLRARHYVSAQLKLVIASSSAGVAVPAVGGLRLRQEQETSGDPLSNVQPAGMLVAAEMLPLALWRQQ